MKPPFAYFGGKSTMARAIANLLPPHRNYLEPFAGSLAVLFAKRPTVNEIVNDVDGDIVTFFRVLRDRPEDLERACALTPYARDEYYASAEPATDDLERARRFWCRVNQSFLKTGATGTGWSVTVARTQSPPSSVLARIGRFRDCAARLMGVSIENCDAVELIARATDDTAIYADPPYLAETRSSRSRSGGDYQHDMLREDDHRRLAEVLTATPAAVIVSGYPSALYTDLYAGWYRLEIPTRAASSNANRSDRGARTEVLWSNRPLAVQLVFADDWGAVG